MEGPRDASYSGGFSSDDDRGSDGTNPTEELPFEAHNPGTIDLEAQEDPIAPEYTILTSTKYVYLALYFALNLVLTLYNKAILGKVHSA